MVLSSLRGFETTSAEEAEFMDVSHCEKMYLVLIGLVLVPVMNDILFKETPFFE